MTRLLMSLALAALALAWVLEPCPARADETTVIYEEKSPPAGQEAAKAEAPPAATPVENIISNTGYSVGLQAGYGIQLWGSHHLDLIEAQPSLAFPISNVIGSSFYRGVLEYRIEPFFGLIKSENYRGEAGLAPIGLRYNFTPLGGRVVPFVEGLLGVVYLNVPKDVQGSRFNFTSSAGAGVRFFVSDRVALDITARIRHTSNAGIREPNVGYNTGFLLLGMDYY